MAVFVPLPLTALENPFFHALAYFLHPFITRYSGHQKYLIPGSDQAKCDRAYVVD